MKHTNQKQPEYPCLEDERTLVRWMGRAWKGFCSDPPRILRWFLYVCGAVLLLDLLFLLPAIDRHAHFKWEDGVWFYAVYGFICYVALVLVCEYVLRPLLMRDEDYYD